MTFRDVRDVEIKTGDLVSFIHRWSKSGELATGKVVGFTPQMVKIEFHFRGKDRAGNYMPYNVCVIQQKEA